MNKEDKNYIVFSTDLTTKRLDGSVVPILIQQSDLLTKKRAIEWGEFFKMKHNLPSITILKRVSEEELKSKENG